jgi:hypothetical protein
MLSAHAKSMKLEGLRFPHSHLLTNLLFTPILWLTSSWVIPISSLRRAREATTCAIQALLVFCSFSAT